jgi:hypothetical protein
MGAADRCQYTNIWTDIRRAVEGLENGREREGRGREERDEKKIKTEEQLLAVFECGRIFGVLQRGRCVVRERAHRPPAPAQSVIGYTNFNCANHLPLSQKPLAVLSISRFQLFHTHRISLLPFELSAYTRAPLHLSYITLNTRR